MLSDSSISITKLSLADLDFIIWRLPSAPPPETLDAEGEEKCEDEDAEAE